MFCKCNSLLFRYSRDALLEMSQRDKCSPTMMFLQLSVLECVHNGT